MSYLVAAYAVVFGTVASYAAWIHVERRAAARDARRSGARDSDAAR